MPHFFNACKTLTHTTPHQKDDPIVIFPQSESLTILLIEDNESDVFLIRKAFDNVSIQVTLFTMHTEKEVFNFLKHTSPHSKAKGTRSRPDLILLDLELPRMDGLSILHQLKAEPALSDIPVIIISGHLDAKVMIACYKAQASGYIPKPFDFKTLQNTLEILTHYWGRTVSLPSQQFNIWTESHSRLNQTHDDLSTHTTKTDQITCIVSLKKTGLSGSLTSCNSHTSDAVITPEPSFLSDVCQ